jgi:hypothetical protein
VNVSSNCINRLIITEIQCVFCNVGTEYLKFLDKFLGKKIRCGGVVE